MPLIDLQTNLRSLKYGNDRPGGASSRQPFITTDIPGGPDRAVPYSAAADNSDYEGNSPDFFLRNGILNLQDSAQDVARITKWFATPIGLAFIAKQNLLERQNVPMPANGGGVLQRLYLPTSTIAQAGVLSLGYHLNKKGLNPFTQGYAVEGESAEGYFKTTLTQDVNNGNSRLTSLYKVKNYISTQLENQFAQSFYNISTNSGILFSYNGGPNSPIPGLGKTNIRFAGSGRRNRVNNDRTVGDAEDILNNVITLGGITVRPNFTEPPTPAENIGSTKLISLNEQYNPSIKTFNREDTYKTQATDKEGGYQIDWINFKPSLKLTDFNSDLENDPRTKDLIKFYFEIIDPTIKENTQNEFLFFRAYINSITDNFKAEWTPYKYVGRAENFYKYGGFGRDVQLSFVIYAHTRNEMIPLYNKLNRLLGTTAPRYSGVGLMLGNFVRITVGDYFNNMPSIINSINLTPSFEAGWDINRNSIGEIIKPEGFNTGSNTINDELCVGQVPKMIEVSLGFTPIHDFVPQYGEDFVREKVN